MTGIARLRIEPDEVRPRVVRRIAVPPAEMTTEIVAAFVAHRQLPPAEINGVIGLVANRLASLGAEATQAGPAKPERWYPCGAHSGGMRSSA